MPSTESGWSAGRVGEGARKNHSKSSPIKQETPQTLTLKFRKYQKQSKYKNPDLKTQKTPETTQGENLEKRKTIECGGGVKVN